jgi:hypothetical protein
MAWPSWQQLAAAQLHPKNTAKQAGCSHGHGCAHAQHPPAPLAMLTVQVDQGLLMNTETTLLLVPRPQVLPPSRRGLSTHNCSGTADRDNQRQKLEAP